MTMPTSSTAGMKMKCADVMFEKFIGADRRQRDAADIGELALDPTQPLPDRPQVAKHQQPDERVRDDHERRRGQLLLPWQAASPERTRQAASVAAAARAAASRHRQRRHGESVKRDGLHARSRAPLSLVAFVLLRLQALSSLPYQSSSDR